MPLHVILVCIGLNGLFATLFAWAGVNSIAQSGLNGGAVAHFVLAATLGYTAWTVNRVREHFGAAVHRK